VVSNTKAELTRFGFARLKRQMSKNYAKLKGRFTGWIEPLSRFKTEAIRE